MRLARSCFQERIASAGGGLRTCFVSYRQLSHCLKSNPNCIGLFLFDQSSNHPAMPADGLLAHRLNGGDMKPEYTRDGWFVGPGGEVVFQPMVYGENHIDETKRGTKKGLKTIWLERDMWKEALRKSCGNESNTENMCCAVRVLANQPDFRA
ncbi:hypothetical protein V1523DRAFT_399097 [Lipomyces doorenjongii]